ncbi:replication protein O [Caballeronia sordidicola]|nr:replication protein O [Caballeronia sordidicola]
MLIAQHSVAGEGVVCPLPLHNDSVSTDQIALNEFLAGQSNLPWVVFRAAHRAANYPTLPARARAVLAALARTVDANDPYASIFARRELLTGRALQSMRTFYRSLDDLETAGLIERAPQKRYGTAGLFGRAYLHLTERSAMVLGYISASVETESAEEPAESQDSRPAVLDSTFETPCVSVADGAIYKDLFPKNQKRQPGRLPADLERLLSLGFRQFLIFKLMREAKTHAKLLSDVVEATWDHLKQAKRPISYLRALLRSPVDFSHQIRAKHAADERKTREAKHAAQVELSVSESAGKTFIDTEESKLIVVSSDAQSISVHYHREVSPRVATGQWAESFVAAIRTNTLKEATFEQIKDFQRNRPNAVIRPVDAQTEATAEAQARTRTADIGDRLNEMKRTLRAACAGVSRAAKGGFPDDDRSQNRAGKPKGYGVQAVV